MTQLFQVDPGPPPFPLFDVQVRLDRRTGDDDAWRRVFAEARVERACVEFVSTPKPGTATEGEGLEDAPWSDGNLVWLRRIDQLDSFESRADQERIGGVILRPENDGLPTGEQLEAVAASALPVVVQVGRPDGRGGFDPRQVAGALLPRLPGPLIFAHLGAFPCDAVRVETAVDLAVRHDRVFLDTSMTCLAGFLSFAARRAPEKLLFGSGFPRMHPRVAWDHLASAIADENRLEDIGRRQAEAIFQQTVTHG